MSRRHAGSAASGSVAVSAGYVSASPRSELFRYMDAANIDLKAFTERFYYRLTGAHLAPVLDTLRYLRHETQVWLEITTLLIPEENDSPAEIGALSEWVARELGPDVPVHFTAFHPDWKMMDKAPTPPSTLARARAIAMDEGLRYVYTGNVHDPRGGSTLCHSCGATLVVRDWYVIETWRLSPEGRCPSCGTPCAGVFDGAPGAWGARRLPVRLDNPVGGMWA